MVDSNQTSENIPRGRGPWPKINSVQAVSKWLMERLKRKDGDERESLAVSRLLLDYVSGMDRSERIRQQWCASESQLEKLSLMADRWSSDEPLQYILNEAHFMGLTLQADPRALIPRPETEELVHALLDRIPLGVSEGLRLLDIGTGSGCIALAWKSRRPEDHVVGLDVSEDSLAQARRNAENLRFNDLDWTCRDILMENSDWPSSPFDMVVSNPPYIPNMERHTLAADVVNQEPEMALFVPDSDPLLFYRRIVDGCCQQGWLMSGGWLGFECHRDFTEEVCALFKDAYWRDVDRRKDLSGNWRMVFARLR